MKWSHRLIASRLTNLPCDFSGHSVFEFGNALVIRLLDIRKTSSKAWSTVLMKWALSNLEVRYIRVCKMPFSFLTFFLPHFCSASAFPKRKQKAKTKIQIIFDSIRKKMSRWNETLKSKWKRSRLIEFLWSSFSDRVSSLTKQSNTQSNWSNPRNLNSNHHLIR